MASHVVAGRAVGLRVAQLRRQQGLSQAKLALMLGMNRTTITRVEAGKANPTLKTLARIAEGLNVSMRDLFDGDL